MPLLVKPLIQAVSGNQSTTYCKARTMFWITDEEHALDGVERGAGQPGKGVGGGGCALRVALQDEALVRVACKGRLDLPDNVGGAGSRVLRGIGGVDGVVNFASGELALDVRVHSTES